ncbi:hypothetical protein N0V83_008034 [Neocucurbitaria cava]|uniref:Uncharacterized protein n=1 Tax=Neocucurbitaria cava TaxID=798079 RepID=A0A9W8Y5D6_9PLEO|nr:hypothetical protein N0V83_008034 [Neocucurbitaria cava]
MYCRLTQRPLVDDVPSILSALQRCGDTGTIAFPANQTFNIRSPLDLSSCRRCGNQINGNLNLSPDWDYWVEAPAVFLISNTSNMVMSSSEGNTGMIDAMDFGWTRVPDVPVPDRMPNLFSIIDGSYQVYIRNLKIRYAPGTVFHVGSESSAIRFEDVEIQSEATTGYLIENAQHVYIWNSIVRATGSCVKIAPNATNIQVEDVRCYTVALNGPPPSEIELTTSVTGAASWIRNIFVNSFVGTGWMNVVAFAAAQADLAPQSLEIKNATFTDISFGDEARQAVYVEQSSAPLTATVITFRAFTGTV